MGFAGLQPAETKLYRMPKRMPDRIMPDRMSEDIPDRMPGKMSEDLPDRMPDRMSEDMPDRMSEDMPDRMSEDMPDGMPDRYARWNARKNLKQNAT